MTNQEEPKKLILICIDSCEHSLHAFNWYYDNFYHKKDKIAILHVYTRPDVPPYGYVEGYPIEIYEREQEGWLEQELKKSEAVTAPYEKLCKERNIDYDILYEPKGESVGQTICEVAKQKDVRCIVMGQRGLGPIKRTVLGSVSERVLHNANMTVLIVPPEKGHKCSK